MNMKFFQRKKKKKKKKKILLNIIYEFNKTIYLKEILVKKIQKFLY